MTDLQAHKLSSSQREVLKRMADGAYIEGVWYPRPILREGGSLEHISWQVARGLSAKGLITNGFHGSSLLYSITTLGRAALEEG